jgi:hypothetical protein
VTIHDGVYFRLVIPLCFPCSATCGMTRHDGR